MVKYNCTFKVKYMIAAFCFSAAACYDTNPRYYFPPICNMEGESSTQTARLLFTITCQLSGQFQDPEIEIFHQTCLRMQLKELRFLKTKKLGWVSRENT